MKRILSIILVVASLTLTLAGASACMQQDTSKTTFEVMGSLPWKTSTAKETMKFKYEKLGMGADGTHSEIVEQGEFTLRLSDGAETRIDTSAVIKDASGNIVTEMTSTVKFASDSSLAPHYSYKKITTYNVNNSPEWVDYGYEIEVNYEEGQRSSSGTIGGQQKPAIEIPDVGTYTYDNEQIYYVVRSAMNLTGEGNSGTFNVVNMADSYFAGTLSKQSMIYTVEANQTIDISPLLGVGDKMPCHKVKLAINANQSGPGTYLYYSAKENPFGEGKGSRVLMCVERDQYNVTTFEKLYVHRYTLVEYSIN